MGKRVKLEQIKATKLAEGEVLTGIYQGQRKQRTKYGERTLHSFEVNGETVEVWGTSLLDRSPQLAGAIGKRVELTLVKQGDKGVASQYELEIG